MSVIQSAACTAFAGTRCIGAGELSVVARQVKELLQRDPDAQVLIFDDATSHQLEVDFRGSVRDVVKRLSPSPVTEAAELPAAPDQDCAMPRGPGRPRLGVIAREVTLLPRHWEWLNSQPGGASVALRKLVEDARRNFEGRDRIRSAQTAANRFMTAMAGNFPGFEEATRALFAGNREKFQELIKPWPADIQRYARKLAGAAFASEAEERAD